MLHAAASSFYYIEVAIIHTIILIYLLEPDQTNKKKYDHKDHKMTYNELREKIVYRVLLKFCYFHI
jgi:hypothetical protein